MESIFGVLPLIRPLVTNFPYRLKYPCGSNFGNKVKLQYKSPCGEQGASETLKHNRTYPFSLKFSTSSFPTARHHDPNNPAPKHSITKLLTSEMRLTILSLAVIVAGANAITSMTDMPGFIAMRQCAQWPLSFGVKYDMQCDNDICFCNRFPEAITRLINSVSTSSCSGTDIDSATSILSAFCEQVPSLTYHFDTPVATGAVATSAAGNGAGQTTAVVTPAAPASSGSFPLSLTTISPDLR